MDKKLKEIEKNRIGVEKGFDPKGYFKDRTGLYVYSNFISRIVDKAQIPDSDAHFDIDSFDIEKSLADEEIEGALPEKHIFSETDVCAVIASLISNQSKGEKGILLNNGYWNLFYTRSFVVDVRWGDSRWRVGAWLRVGRRWGGGRRVFSPATGI